VTLEFEPWGKTPRFVNETITITEKIDGTNACIVILPFDAEAHHDLTSTGKALMVNMDEVPGFEPTHTFATQSRKKFIWPGKQSDNAGFAAWAWENAYDIISDLGYGKHYGEWWGRGIQRNYGLDTKKFSLFNPWRYSEDGDRLFTVKEMGTVPTLYTGDANTENIYNALRYLEEHGSVAAPEWRTPEGIIISYKLAQTRYKLLINDDGIPKSLKEGK
jgi:hypothetical protein